MRFREIQGGLQVPVSNEEQELVDLIEEEGGIILKKKLNIRHKELARKLTSRGVLKRVKREDKLYYKLNNLEDLWRF